MVRPPDAEIAKLMQVAHEIRDTTDESGFTVGEAVRQHEAFSHTRGPASALERSLILDAARRGASQAGLGPEDVSGGGLDIVTMSDSTIRRYRLRRVKLNAGGEYEVICGMGSSLLVSDPESLLREEKWIIGYVTSDDHTIEHLIAAEVVDWRGNGPVYLVLRTIVDLSDDQPPRGFTSTDEDLPGFEEEEGEGEAGNFTGF